MHLLLDPHELEVTVQPDGTLLLVPSNKELKAGRTVSVHLSLEPMREAMEWLNRYERFWTVSIDRLVALVEEDGER